MNFMSVFLVFIISWWLVLFMLLPVGLKMEDNPEDGHAASAPKAPLIKQKMLGATIISAILTAAYYAAVHYKVISLSRL